MYKRDEEEKNNELSDRLLNILQNTSSTNESPNINPNSNKNQINDINPYTGFSNRLTNIMANTQGLDKLTNGINEANKIIQGTYNLVNSNNSRKNTVTEKDEEIISQEENELLTDDMEVQKVEEPQEELQIEETTNNTITPEQQRQNFESYINTKRDSIQTVSNAIQQNAQAQEEAKQENKTLIEQANQAFRSQYPATVNTQQEQTNSITKPEVKVVDNSEIKDLKVMNSGDMYKLTDGQIDDRSNIQKTVDEVLGSLGNFAMGMESVVPSTVKYIDAAGENATRKASEKILNLLFHTDENTSEIIGQQVFSKLWEFNELAKINNELNSDELENWRKQTIAKNTSKTSTPLGKKLAEITPSVGQNIVPMAISYFNPPAGTALFMTSAAGSYLEDAEERGMNKDQALTYATVMGTFEGATEEVISGKMLSNSMKLFGGVGLSDEVLNSFGVSTAENFLQEAIMEPLQETTAQVIGGKDKANWDNILNRSLEAGVDGILSAILLNGVSVGIASANNVINKKNPTQQEIQTALADTINSGKVDINDIINGATQAIKENKFYINTESFFINETTADNETTNIKETKGIRIDLINDKLDVNPAVVKDGNSFIVIDIETGLKLDTSNYTSQTEAIKGFDDKIRNIDNATINNINNKITQTKLSLINRIQQVENNNNIVENSNSSEEQIKIDSENFAKQVDGVLSGSFPQRDMLTLLSNTPKPLQDIGLTDLPITMTQKHLKSIMNANGNDKNANYHDLGIDIVKQLPEAISNPLDIVESNTRDDSVVLTTYLADSKGRTVIASIKIDGSGLVNKILVDTNVMTSAYGRNNYEAWMDKNLKDGKLLYDIDRGVIKKVDVARLQLPRSTNSELANARFQLPRISNSDITNSVTYNDQNVNKITTNSNYNYMQNEEKKYTQKQYNDIRKTINQISDKTLYNNGATINTLRTVSNNVENVNLIEQNGNYYLNSLDENGQVTYKQKIGNRPYTGKKIKEIVNSAIQNADTSNINISQNTNTDIVQTSSQENTANLQSQETSYTPQDVQKIVEPFSPQEEYTKNEMAKIWNEEINANDLDVLYDSNGNIHNYIAIEEDGGKIYTNLYDSNDNLIKSEVISSKNGKYTAETIKNSIEKITDTYNDNIKTSSKKETKIDKKIKEYIKNNPNLETDIKIKMPKELLNINTKSITQMEAYKIARNLFNEIHKRKFINNGEGIYTTNTDIKESINTTYTYTEQRKLLKENIALYSFLDKIIENGTEISNENELKGRKKYQDWKYYATPINIDNQKYIVEFDTVKRESGERHFRVERLYKINQGNSATVVPTKKLMTRFTAESPTINNSIPQKTETVKSDTAIDNKSTQKTTNYAEQKQIQKELHNRIQNSILSKNSRKNTFLGNVAEKVANKIKKLYGIDVTGRRHMVSDYDIRHIIKQHGNPIIEQSKGQIAVTSKDIEKIPDIINNFDKILKGTPNIDTRTGREFNTIRYVKTYNDNISYVVEVIPSNNNQLNVKTMWKKPIQINKKNNSIGVNHGYHDAKALHYTSETKSNSSYSNTSIPQNMENVKDDGVRSMKKSNTNTTNNQYNNYSKKEIENLNSPKIKIANSENDVITFVENAKKMPSSLKLYFGKVSNNISTKIKSTLGIDIKDYNISLRTNTVKHIINAHGDLNTETLRGQLPITEQDIANIPNIINHYDNVKDGGLTEQGKPSIIFEKNIKGNTVVVTYVSDRHHNLEVQTMYKFKNNKKRDSATATNATNALETTSETVSGTKSLNTSVTQNTENVKNEDIRFAKRTAKNQNENIDTTQRNAERQGAYIEQEIQKIEQTGNWDDSIPVTKLTDIRKIIEDYLGLGIKKGHFREQAYAIYKGNRDVIRTKEYKDIDSILHETGHALDIGNRLNIDKESISNELLTAIDKLGGYEQETREIRLEEGFAEVIREYSIVPDQAKLEYPQTVSIIEKIRQNDKSFNNFIAKVQEQTYNYIHQNPRNRTLSNMSIGEQTDKSPLTKSWLKQEIMRNIYDKDYALKSAVNELAKAGGKTANSIRASENAYLLTRTANGIGEKVTSMLADGYIDENGNKLMPGLNQIGEILNNDSQRFDDLRAYLVAQRDIEYKAKSLKTGVRSMDSKAVIEQFQNDTQIQQAAKLVYDTLDGVMQYAVDNGLITQETVENLKESNAFYVPMQRVLENKGNQVGKRGAVSDIIKRRTGSELDIKDVLENIVANSSNIIQQVENNNVLKAFYKQGEGSGLTGAIYDVIDTPMTKIGTAQLSTWKTELNKQGVDTTNLDLEKTIDLFAPNNKVDSKNLITSFINDNGKRVYLQFNDEILFNSLMNMDKKFMSQVLKINSKMNMPLRYGATMANIGFAIPNMISDTAQAAIYSTAGFIPVVDNALGVLDILATTNKTVGNFVNKVAPEYANRINTLYTIYQQSGATSSTRLSQYRESSQSVMKDVYGTKKSENLGIKENFKPLKRLLDLMTYIPEISEQSTRFEVFKKNYNYYKNKGNSEMDSRIMAAIESRDATQDFGRTGNITREINQLIPFSAARVGSIYTFAEKVKANPKQVGMRIAVLTALAMTIKAIGYDDDEIEELNQRKKDDNFVFKVGDNVVTIKKPQGILRSMINLTEYIQDLATGHIEEGKEGERLGEWLNNAIMDNMPADSVTGLVPNMVAPLIENAINKDFYYNTDIVKSYDLDLPNKDQYYEYNSQLAIILGNIFNYSPAKIDNLISGYFGGLGTQVTNIMDTMLGKAGIIAEKADMGAETNAVGKRFIVNVNSNSASIDEIYTRKEELTKKKNGGTITEEETSELETITNAISNMSKLNKQIKEIKKDLSMSGKEKANKIKLLQQQRTDTARQALGKDLIYNSNASKIQSTQFYPTSSTLSKNNYVLTLTSDMKKEYEKLANEYYNKYESQGIYSEEKLAKLKSKAKDYAKNQLMQKYKSSLVKNK